MSSGVPYTKEEDRIIIAMHKAGYRPEDISKVLVSRGADQIKDHSYRLGIKWTAAPEIDQEMFKKMMKGK